MKKLLLLSQFFPPETSAAANRVGAMAEVLSKYYEVRVVTLKPSYPSPGLYREFRPGHHDARRSHATTRAFGFSPHEGKLYVRALREHLMALGLAVWSVTAPADIIMVSSPSMFLGPVGLALARAKGAHFVWDVRDVTWSYAQDMAGASTVTVAAARALQRYMLWALRRVDLAVGATPGIAQVLVESGVKPSRMITVPNGVAPELLKMLQKPEKIDTKQRPTVTYAGLVGYNQ
jgi:hypothetical protein